MPLAVRPHGSWELGAAARRTPTAPLMDMSQACYDQEAVVRRAKRGSKS